MSIVFHHVIFRALLRWGAALAFCLPLKHRPGFRLRALGMLLPLMSIRTSRPSSTSPFSRETYS